MSGSPARQRRRECERRGHRRVKTVHSRQFCTDCNTWLDPEISTIPLDEDAPISAPVHSPYQSSAAQVT